MIAMLLNEFVRQELLIACDCRLRFAHGMPGLSHVVGGTSCFQTVDCGCCSSWRGSVQYIRSLQIPQCRSVVAPVQEHLAQLVARRGHGARRYFHGGGENGQGRLQIPNGRVAMGAILLWYRVAMGGGGFFGRSFGRFGGTRIATTVEWLYRQGQLGVHHAQTMQGMSHFN